MCSYILYTFVRNISRSEKNSARCYHKRPYVLVLMKLELLRQIFQRYSDIKFHENPSTENRVVPCGRTEGHESNSHFLHRA
jgi:hypothetical protein